MTADPMNVVLLLPVQLGVEGSAEVMCHSNGGDVATLHTTIEHQSNTRTAAEPGNVDTAPAYRPHRHF